MGNKLTYSHLYTLIYLMCEKKKIRMKELSNLPLCYQKKKYIYMTIEGIKDIYVGRYVV